MRLQINLLRPAVGDLLVCRAEVLKPGKTLTVVESTVTTASHSNEQSKIVAKATVTLAVTRGLV